jgi:hypothetical protein
MDPRDSHDCWMSHKLRAGWRYGPVKDVEAKTHPCLLPYNELSPAQRVKDDVFSAVVAGFRRAKEREFAEELQAEKAL